MPQPSIDNMLELQIVNMLRSVIYQNYKFLTWNTQ